MTLSHAPGRLPARRIVYSVHIEIIFLDTPRYKAQHLNDAHPEAVRLISQFARGSPGQDEGGDLKVRSLNEGIKMNNLVESVYVGFWSRVWASTIDTVLMMAITIPLLMTIYGKAYFTSTSTIKGPMDFIISFIFPAVAVIAFWCARHATPGKMLIGAKIVDARSGEAPSVGQCVGRYFGYFVSTLPLCLGHIWIAFDRRKQGWHDKLAGTVVIKIKD
jgi:uncharacterized RDD family membrane protein YckC